jgi:hypothetical protein
MTSISPNGVQATHQQDVPICSFDDVWTNLMSESLPNPLAVAMSSSSHLQAKSPPTLDPETELIVTEESYVNDLRVLVETFVIPLEAWLSRFDFTKPTRQNHPDYCLESLVCDQKINIIDTLFANIKVILQCNQLLLDSLHTADQANIEGAVIASFVKHAPYLKLYSQYTKNCQRATELLTQLRADIRSLFLPLSLLLSTLTCGRFSSFLACAELQKQCRGLNLQSFLIMPIQRGPRYELLLREMKKRAKSLELKDLVQKAIETIVGVIKNIDSAVVGDERREKLLEIQDAFRISLAEPARYVVKCGDLKKVCHTGRRGKPLLSSRRLSFPDSQSLQSSTLSCAMI